MGRALNGFGAVLRREWSDLGRSALVRMQLLWLPLGAIALLWAVFVRGVVTEIPVAVVDQDRSALSRQLTRMLDASSGLQVIGGTASLEEAREMIWRGDAQACVLVPRDFERDLKRGQVGEVTAWYNAQFILTGNVLSRELQTVVLTFSGQVEGVARLKRGDPPEAAPIRVSPLSARRDSLYNPYVNYVLFLVNGMVFGLIQMLAMLAAVRVVGREFRDSTVPAWLEAAGGRLVDGVAAKLVIPAATLIALSLAWLGFLHGWLGWPMPGSWLVLLCGVVLLVLVYEAFGVLVVSVSVNYRLASSVAAFVTAPAMAFSGLTYPLEAMPTVAFGWANFLPLTAFIRLQLAQGIRGAPAAESWPIVWLLAAATVVFFFAGLLLLRRRVRDRASWGRA